MNHSTDDAMQVLATKAHVLSAMAEYLDMLNTDPIRPLNYRYLWEASGSKYRIVMDAAGSKSVHSFIDATTGDLYKAASWKVPAKGARYNLLTEMELLRFAYEHARTGWAGGYLYGDMVKAARKAYEQQVLA